MINTLIISVRGSSLVDPRTERVNKAGHGAVVKAAYLEIAHISPTPTLLKP